MWLPAPGVSGFQGSQEQPGGVVATGAPTTARLQHRGQTARGKKLGGEKHHFPCPSLKAAFQQAAIKRAQRSSSPAPLLTPHLSATPCFKPSTPQPQPRSTEMPGAAEELQQIPFCQLLGPLLQGLSLQCCCRMLDHNSGPLQATARVGNTPRSCCSLFCGGDLLLPRQTVSIQIYTPQRADFYGRPNTQLHGTPLMWDGQALPSQRDSKGHHLRPPSQALARRNLHQRMSPFVQAKPPAWGREHPGWHSTAQPAG